MLARPRRVRRAPVGVAAGDSRFISATAHRSMSITISVRSFYRHRSDVFRGFDFLPASQRSCVKNIFDRPGNPFSLANASRPHHPSLRVSLSSSRAAYRIFDMFQRSDGAGIERVAIHNRRVHLIGSSARKD